MYAYKIHLIFIVIVIVRGALFMRLCVERFFGFPSREKSFRIEAIIASILGNSSKYNI